MGKIQRRTKKTQFLFWEENSRSDIKQPSDDPTSSMETIRNWFNEFQRGRTSIFDEPRPGVLKTDTTEDNLTKIHDLTLADRRLKVRAIADVLGIAKDAETQI